MKKLLLAFALILTALYSKAQTYTFGIKGGVNIAYQNVASLDSKDIRNITGFHAGGILDIGFNHFSVQPGLFFITKGYQTTVKLFDDVSEKTKLSYLELPVNLLYKFEAGKSTKVFVGSGPYVAYALANAWYIGGQNLGGGLGGENQYKRFDYGANITTGVEIKNTILLSAFYSFGANIYNGPNNIKNKVTGFSVGYLFK